MKELNNFIDNIIFENNIKKNLNESYVLQKGEYKLNTELLTDKNKSAHIEKLSNYIDSLNNVSAEISSENVLNDSFRFSHLKKDEVFFHNAVFLHHLFFENISDVNSKVSMDSLSYMKIAKDFGSFERWQKDFVMCCNSSKNGWAILGYNMNLKRYMNIYIESHDSGLMLGLMPIIVIDCWEHSYYRDYLNNKKAYIYGMMKELNWEIIEKRIKKAEEISKIL